MVYRTSLNLAPFYTPYLIYNSLSSLVLCHSYLLPILRHAKLLSALDLAFVQLIPFPGMFLSRSLSGCLYVIHISLLINYYPHI